jgi:hypothetical protein
MKIYDAREGGGFLFNPPPPPCKASDECHGPGTQVASPPPIGTIEGSGEPQHLVTEEAEARKKCRKGQVRKRGRCVKRTKKKHKGHARRRHG